MSATTFGSGVSAVVGEMTGHLRTLAAAVNNATAKIVFASFICSLSTSLHAKALDDIRVSRVGNIATVEIEFTCAMRYVEHEKKQGGSELAISLSLGDDCRVALLDVLEEMRRPQSGPLANMSEIEFLAEQGDGATLIVRFDKSLSTYVSQTSNLYMLSIEVDRETEVLTADTSGDEPPPEEPDTPIEEIKPPIVNNAGTRQIVDTTSDEQNKYVIRVMRLTEGDEINFALLGDDHSRTLYANDITIGERRWSELKLGFFDSEADAQPVLEQLAPNFSLAWITVANADERSAASRNRIAWPVEGMPEETPVAIEAAASPIDAVATMPPDRITVLMNDARTALLRKNYSTSIELYEELLQEPGDDHRRRAREFLGVARQKNNQPEQAQAEFEAYLSEFPDGEESLRVQQRLAALAFAGNPVATGNSNAAATTAVVDTEKDQPSFPSRSTGSRRFGSWEYYGSASQYYLRGVNLSEGNSDDLVAQSAMLSQAQMIARRRGERFDLLAQANLGYLYDFENTESDNQLLVSYAFLDIADTKTDTSLRLGRQHQLTSGVLGRFDGLHASYQFRPDMTVNVTAGLPVDTSRFLGDSDVYTYGASVDFSNLLDNWDFSVYANQQMVDDIKDRQAIGGEALFRLDRFTLVSLLDFDLSYNILNTALINATWRAHDRLTLHGRVRTGVAPFLSTRNALIGQTVNNIHDLFATFTEGQIRRLARDRTADETFASGGLSAAITPRLQLRLDATYLEYSATVASGGVAAFPESGPQYIYGGHLQGSGYFIPGQVVQLGYRHRETGTIDDDTVWFDLRYPFRERWRIQGRLEYTTRVANQNVAGDIDNQIINPLLRVVYSGDRPFRIEFEGGARLSDREFPVGLIPPLVTDNTLEQNDYYLQLGYILDF